MKKLLTILSLFSFLLFITACENHKPTEEEIIDEVLAPFSDDANAETTAADTSSTGVYQKEVNESEETSLQDAMKSATQEVIDEGGMSFCDCVKKQKKLSDLMLETEDDTIFDKTMDELETLKKEDCKILFATQQNTIEEKQAHERKVKKCLR